MGPTKEPAPRPGAPRPRAARARGADAAKRADFVRAFLKWSKERGYTRENLGTHLRVRKANKSNSNAQTLEEQPVYLTKEGHDNLLKEMEALKERRPLILVPRETPLSAIHLENMLRVTRAGAVVLPASPAFYHRPSGISDLVDSVVARVLDHLRVEHALGQRWGSVADTDA